MAKSKYQDTFPMLAQGYAREGCTDKQIYEKLGIGKETFYKYLRINKDFSDALKEGKKPVDTDVENMLLKRAMGYEYEEVTREVRKSGNDMSVEEKKESGKTSVQYIKKTIKHVVPDVKAQQFWLKNRKPKTWRDRQEISGEDGNPIEHNIKVSFVDGDKKNEK